MIAPAVVVWVFSWIIGDYVMETRLAHLQSLHRARLNLIDKQAEQLQMQRDELLRDNEALARDNEWLRAYVRCIEAKLRPLPVGPKDPPQ